MDDKVRYYVSPGIETLNNTDVSILSKNGGCDSGVGFSRD